MRWKVMSDWLILEWRLCLLFCSDLFLSKGKLFSAGRGAAGSFWKCNHSLEKRTAFVLHMSVEGGVMMVQRCLDVGWASLLAGSRGCHVVLSLSWVRNRKASVLTAAWRQDARLPVSTQVNIGFPSFSAVLFSLFFSFTLRLSSFSSFWCYE